MITPEDQQRKGLVVFSHGKESGPWGSKIRRLADEAKELGWEVESIDYSDLASPEERVERLARHPRPASGRFVLVGSSMGGYVSTVASDRLRPDGLFLMAPAFYLTGYANQDPIAQAGRVEVVLGRDDDIVPMENGLNFAQKHRCRVHVLEDGHRLSNVMHELAVIFRKFLLDLK